MVKTSGITQMFKLLLFTDESHCEKYNRVNVFGVSTPGRCSNNNNKKKVQLHH